MPRFYCPFTLAGQVQVRLAPDQARRAAKVLRLKPGAEVELFDGSGGEYAASINMLNRDGVLVDVGRYSPIEREATLDLTLAQGLASGDKMDDILQKAVQLGVRRFQPLATRKSVVRLTDERGTRRAQHWRQVVISACEQCGRNRLAEVLAIEDIGQWLAQIPVGTKLLLSAAAAMPLASLARPADAVIVLIGPEGGLSDEETRAALDAGFQPVRLGPRVLRTEAAGLAALAAMQALWGDF